MKELKLQRSQKSGPAARKRKKYIYFDQLYFLLPTVENKRWLFFLWVSFRRNCGDYASFAAAPNLSAFLKRVLTIFRNIQIQKTSPHHPDSDSEMDNPVIEEYDFPTIQPGTSREYNNVQMGLGPPKMRGRYSTQICETSLNSFDNDIHDILSSHSQPIIQDEDYDRMFLLSLLPMMKQVPDVKKLDVRIQMQQILAAALYASDSKWH